MGYGPQGRKEADTVEATECAHTHTHTPGPNMETLFKTNNREKFLQSSQKKRYLKYRGIKISMTADFTKEIMQENRAEPLL